MNISIVKTTDQKIDSRRPTANVLPVTLATKRLFLRAMDKVLHDLQRCTVQPNIEEDFYSTMKSFVCLIILKELLTKWFGELV